MTLLLDMSVANENTYSVSWAECQQILVSIYLENIKYI